jgi:L,D-peptidoglycan transpeptidase YkuD (ErfK/YbiS/YcfS/YnhG family)
LPTQALTPHDGWCDDPADSEYNRPVTRPYPARHERLWRDDGIYDVIAVMGYNDDPPRPGAGSAIFLHLARPGFAPTEGCVALALADLLLVLGEASAESRVCVEG